MEETCLRSIFEKAKSLSVRSGFPKPIDLSDFDEAKNVFEVPPRTYLYCGSGEQFAAIPDWLLAEALEELGYRSVPESFLRGVSRAVQQLFQGYPEAPAMAVVTTAYCHLESLFPAHSTKVLSAKPVFRGVPVSLLGAYGTEVSSRDLCFSRSESESIVSWESRRQWVREGAVAFDEWEQTVSTLPAADREESVSLANRLSRYRGVTRQQERRPEYVDSPGIGFTRLLPRRGGLKASRETLWLTLEKEELRCLEVSMTSCEFTDFLPMNYRIDWDRLATSWGI